MTIPIVDERVRYVGVSALRSLNAKTLRELTDLLVVQVDEKPVAVIIPISIYMEIQPALWPSSLVPSLCDLFGTAAATQQFDDSIKACNAARDEYRKGLTVEPTPSETPGVSEEALRVCDGVTHDTLGPHDSCSQHPETRAPIVTLGEGVGDGTFRGAKFSGDELQEARDKSLVFDDLSIEEQEGVQRQCMENLIEAHVIPKCAHCGNPSDKPLCRNCFIAGHRASNCNRCAEVTT